MKRITTNKISELLTGDFFLYPEDGLENLEMQLRKIDRYPRTRFMDMLLDQTLMSTVDDFIPVLRLHG
jgi:hypothetical protein